MIQPLIPGRPPAGTGQPSAGQPQTLPNTGQLSGQQLQQAQQTSNRVYFDPNDMHDILLARKVTPEIILQSTIFIEDTAGNYGVTPDRIADPTPYKISKLAMYYAYMTAALESSYMGSNGSQDGADAYELKRRVYAGMVASLLGEITADTFTNGQSSVPNSFPMSIPYYRS